MALSVLDSDEVAQVTRALQTDAEECGLFEYRQGHAILAAHGQGLGWWCYVEKILPWAARSGLVTVSAVLTYKVMVTLNTATTQPLDLVDPRVTGATTALLRRYIGRYTLGGLVAEVDVFGAGGNRLTADAGWLTIGGDGGARYRCMVITLPLVLNDLFTEIP